MTLAFSLAIAILFGAGASLLVGRDIVRIAGGTVLLSNATILYLLATSLSRGSAPIEPIRTPTSDPLVQALALTAIVISFGVTAMVFALVHRLAETNHGLDLDRIAEMESEDEAERADEA